MEINTAISALGALAQEHRLAAFRILVRVGEDGMAAGDLARSIAVPHNTMSTHLSVLSQAGLITSQRNGRSIIYRIVPDVMRDLLGFLADDCCQGRPELCGIAVSGETSTSTCC
ncbi:MULTISPECIES: ArsR/SmtB family transcription factor [Thalassospira]|uniref:ArsR family transcriptional regulator n=2 Tax=Thalassospira TaxID=168934 RepID=A0AB72U868_9PROT|nr:MULTISPECIES: metalloregulator ArsR/SmtB family transcription factor [Thalassospira]AJD50423.1 ArsR family transcriptional regulator [Thalassospira xiamenensis M-5 = DSM 17429]KEO55733.1 ArsR family transcriptional regulator [Thalassospira permensis NBRC 106175]SIS79285.1 transcriptional regulator, ArsR family [Thalassospira xiamenensis M-5 = DSM 17429]